MRKTLCAVTALVLAAGALVAPAASSSAREQAAPTSVTVSGDGTHVAVSSTAVDAGYVSFHVRATSPVDSDIVLFRPKANATLADVVLGFREEFSTNPKVAAKGTRDLTRDATFFGLALVSRTTPATVTRRLTRGSYYLIDLGNYPAVPLHATALTVRRSGSPHHRPPAYSATVTLTSADRYVTPGTLPARGTVRVRNLSDTLHFMDLMRVKKGTTDAAGPAVLRLGRPGPTTLRGEGARGGDGRAVAGTSGATDVRRACRHLRDAVLRQR